MKSSGSADAADERNAPAIAGEDPLAVVAAQSPATQRPWLGRISPLLPPGFALVEMLVLVGLVMAEYIWEGFPSLTRMNPHPYWIAILLLSLQYGTVSGLIAAGIAIIGTVLIGMPEPDIEERYFNYLIRVWTQPVLWLLVAMLLGTFRARQIEQRDELRQANENLRMRGATLLDHATNLRARCTMLERRIAVRETSDTGKLLSALARLGEAEPGRWSAALDDALSAAFPKSQLSVYAADGSQARLVLTHQRAANPAPVSQTPPEIPQQHQLLASVVGQGRPVSVIDASDDKALRGMGVAAVPIFASATDGASRKVIGILKAEVLAPSQLDASTVRRLGVIAAYLAPVLQRGLIVPIGDTAAAGEDAIQPVRKWRFLKWLPGGRGAAPAADGADG